MQEIKHRIFLLAGLVTCRSIYCHTASKASFGILIPDLWYGSMRYLVDLVEICLSTAYQEIVGNVGDVTHGIDVEMVGNTGAIHHHCIAIKLWCQRSCGCKRPHTLLILLQIGYSRHIILTHRGINFLSWQEVTCYLYFMCLWCHAAESNGLVCMNLRRLWHLPSEEGLLSEGRSTKRTQCYC